MSRFGDALADRSRPRPHFFDRSSATSAPTCPGDGRPGTSPGRSARCPWEGRIGCRSATAISVARRGCVALPPVDCDLHLGVGPAAVIAEVARRFARSVVDDRLQDVFARLAESALTSRPCRRRAWLSGASNVTVPGPRYFAHSPSCRPARRAASAGRRRWPRRSSVADAGRSSRVAAACSVTTGGRFELIFSLLPPRVVRRRSICQTGFSVPTTCCGLAVRASASRPASVSPKSFGTRDAEHVLVAARRRNASAARGRRPARTCCPAPTGMSIPPRSCGSCSRTTC